ncbi:MAG: nucleoside deaminase [Planctomycetota bacterium]
MTSDFPTAAERRLLDAAIAQAEKSWREGGIPIGAALGDESGTVLAVGHNLRVQTGDPTAHAEVVCIRSAGRRRDWKRLTLATTLSPCVMCTGTALLLRIPRIVIGENRTFLGGEDLLRERGVSIALADDERCITMMKRMQRERADVWAEDIGDPDET